MAQTSEQFEVRGRVTGESGSIPGVSVLLKGTTTGTTTDTNGNYSLRVSENSILVFSYVGFASQEIPVNGRSVIDVEMETDIKALQEVVVTALGIEKDSKSLGYATATVDADQIATNRSVNFMNAIQGKVPGLNISGMGTGPAGTSKIRIRGQSSFGGQNSPLIVVNGVPIDNSNFGSTSGSRSTESSLSDGGSRTVSDGGDGLSSINPDDIESMTVLKGAAASALYGSRAKDGVIMITTKSGGKNGFVVEYNSNYTNETPLDFTDFQYEYGQGEGGLRPTTANPTSGVWSFGEKFEPGMTQILFDGVEAPYAPVRDRIRTFYRNGQSFTNTISISNGGEFGSLRLSASNLDNKGIVPNNTFKRQSVNVNFRQQMAQRFNVTGSINYSHDRNENAPTVATQDLSTPTVIYSLSNSMPFDLLESEAEDEFGNERIYSRFRNRTNPYFVLNNHFNHITRDRVFGNVAARYNFTDWLYAQVRMGQDYTFRFQEDNGRPTGAASLGVAPAGFVNGEYR
ncbi:MAG: TonB-dependent receptor plug domain-containing protein, partial [Cyclobacteriaceae bacterium]